MDLTRLRNKVSGAFRAVRLPYHWELLLLGTTSRGWIMDGDPVSAKAVDYDLLGAKAERWCEERCSGRNSYLWKDFSLEELADGIKESRQSVKNWFQIVLAEDFRSWKIRKRIALAEKILREREKVAVSELAAMVSFRDVPNFCRQFKRFTGLTPSEMKAQLEG